MNVKEWVHAVAHARENAEILASHLEQAANRWVFDLTEHSLELFKKRTLSVKNLRQAMVRTRPPPSKASRAEPAKVDACTSTARRSTGSGTKTSSK